MIVIWRTGSIGGRVCPPAPPQTALPKSVSSSKSRLFSCRYNIAVILANVCRYRGEFCESGTLPATWRQLTRRRWSNTPRAVDMARAGHVGIILVFVTACLFHIGRYIVLFVVFGLFVIKFVNLIFIVNWCFIDKKILDVYICTIKLYMCIKYMCISNKLFIYLFVHIWSYIRT